MQEEDNDGGEGVRDAGGCSLQDAVAAHLRARHLLLLLDNFEHLLAAAPLLADLCAVCADPTLLVTSRCVLQEGYRRVYLYLVKRRRRYAQLRVPCARGTV